MPSGTVTFLFTDIEGSTSLFRQLESELATDFEMDDARRETLDGLTKAAGELITVQADDLETIAKRLAVAGPV